MNMKVSFLALLNRTLRGFGKNPEMKWVDPAVREIFPSTTTRYDSAIFLDDHLDKITGSAFGDVEKQISKIKEIKKVQPPIYMLNIKNCFATEKYIFSGARSKIFNVKLKDKFLFNKEFPAVDCLVALPTSFLGCNFFGHWLRDDCATELLAMEHGETYWLDTPAWPDKTVYQDLFGQTIRRGTGRFFRELILFDDVGQNPHKIDRFRRLRDRLRSTRAAANPELVYLRRGRGGSARNLVNEEALLALMRRLGATVVEPEVDADALISSCLGARIVISIEGSQLSHALYTLRDNGGLLVVQPPDRFYTSHRDWSAEMDFVFAFVVGDPTKGGFLVDLADLEKTLTLLTRRLDQRAAGV